MTPEMADTSAVPQFFRTLHGDKIHFWPGRSCTAKSRKDAQGHRIINHIEHCTVCETIFSINLGRTAIPDMPAVDREDPANYDL
jgi:hypothetical protein